MTLQQLKDFLAVVSHGSFRAASRSLDVSQAGLTNSIKALELSLDAVLLTRTAHGVVLTEAGEHLLRRARLIEAESTRAADEIVQLKQGRQGLVRVGLSPAASGVLLTHVVPDFRRRYPQAELRIYGGLYERLVPAVLQGQIDFAVLALHGPLGKELNSRELMRVSLAIAVRKGHPRQGCQHLAGLGADEWVLLGPAGAPGSTILDCFARKGLAAPKVAVVCDSFLQVAALLSGTDYLALVPRPLLHHQLLGPAVEELVIADPLGDYDLCLITRKDVQLAPLTQQLARMFTSFARSMR